jgi:hypothetical protein
LGTQIARRQSPYCGRDILLLKSYSQSSRGRSKTITLNQNVSSYFDLRQNETAKHRTLPAEILLSQIGVARPVLRRATTSSIPHDLKVGAQGSQTVFQTAQRRFSVLTPHRQSGRIAAEYQIQGRRAPCPSVHSILVERVTRHVGPGDILRSAKDFLDHAPAQRVKHRKRFALTVQCNPAAANAEPAAAFSDYNVLVGTMTEEELRRAIEGPTQLVGCELESGLVDYSCETCAFTQRTLWFTKACL